MLTTCAPSTTTTKATAHVKSLDFQPCRDDEKDLEVESEELANNQMKTNHHLESENEIQHIEGKTEVQAILLKEDGTVEQISYDASSSNTRELLSELPVVIGAIKNLDLVAVPSLSKSTSCSVHRYTVPVQLCIVGTVSGEYVLIRVDSAGKTGDVTLAEYMKYVEEKAVKWCRRFHRRDPTDDERQHIVRFMMQIERFPLLIEEDTEMIDIE